MQYSEILNKTLYVLNNTLAFLIFQNSENLFPATLWLEFQISMEFGILLEIQWMIDLGAEKSLRIINVIKIFSEI